MGTVSDRWIRKGYRRVREIERKGEREEEGG